MTFKDHGLMALKPSFTENLTHLRLDRISTHGLSWRYVGSFLLVSFLVVFFIVGGC